MNNQDTLLCTNEIRPCDIINIHCFESQRSELPRHLLNPTYRWKKSVWKETDMTFYGKQDCAAQYDIKKKKSRGERKLSYGWEV